jgi:hypothetical protein
MLFPSVPLPITRLIIPTQVKPCHPRNRNFPIQFRLQVLRPSPYLNITLGQSDRSLHHLHNIDPLLGGADWESGASNNPRPRVVLREIGEAQEVDGKEEDLVSGAKGEEDFLYCVSARI